MASDDGRAPLTDILDQLCSTSKEEIGSETVRSVLFGRWPAWGGQTPNPAQVEEMMSSLPPGVLELTPPTVRLSVSSVSGEPALGVFAAQPLNRGTEMGPCAGKLTTWEEFTNSGPIQKETVWEVFVSGECKVLRLCFEGPRSWLSYVQCARHEREQNIETLQVGQQIFYRATKFIPSDHELLVWYGTDVPQYLGVPTAIPLNDKDREQSTQASNDTSSLGGFWKCVLCSRGFNTRSNLRSHMRIHTMQRPFICGHCGRSFSQSSTLRNHVRLHTGERPYKCDLCHCAYSQLAGLRAHQKSGRHSNGKKEPIPQADGK